MVIYTFKQGGIYSLTNGIMFYLFYNYFHDRYMLHYTASMSSHLSCNLSSFIPPSKGFSTNDRGVC